MPAIADMPALEKETANDCKGDLTGPLLQTID
jgi:hypothetical protein